MAAYETYETDKDYDTMEMENTSAVVEVIYKSIILVRRKELNLRLVWQLLEEREDQGKMWVFWNEK